MLKTVVKSCIGKLGYQLVRRPGAGPQDKLLLQDHEVGYDHEKEILSAVAVVRTHTMLPYVRLATLYQQVLYCEQTGIPGAFVECGTWKGGATGLMALANLKYGAKRRHLHLFDSFEGIPEPDQALDGERAISEARMTGITPTGKLKAMTGFYEKFGMENGLLAHNKDLLESKIRYPADHIHYQVGWFQNTIAPAANTLGPIAILRLDGDWYASTKVCLDHLYDLVSPGGVVIADDYGHYEGCRKAVDEFLLERREHPYLHHIDAAGRYWIKT